MTIPDLNEHGVLPRGVHHCNMEEVRARFGTFRQTDARPRLCDHLVRYMTEAGSTGAVAAVFVDGSFVTNKEVPGDVDLIVVVNEDALPSSTVDVSPHVYNVVSRRVIKKRFPFDVFVVPNDPEAIEGALEFFAQVKDRADLSKGILRVTP